MSLYTVCGNPLNLNKSFSFLAYPNPIENSYSRRFFWNFISNYGPNI